MPSDTRRLPATLFGPFLGDQGMPGHVELAPRARTQGRFVSAYGRFHRVRRDKEPGCWSVEEPGGELYTVKTQR